MINIISTLFRQHIYGVYGKHKPKDIGLENVDNTSDIDKPVSTAVQTALDNIVSGSGGIISVTTLPENPTEGQTVLLRTTDPLSAQLKIYTNQEWITMPIDINAIIQE